MIKISIVNKNGIEVYKDTITSKFEVIKMLKFYIYLFTHKYIATRIMNCSVIQKEKSKDHEISCKFSNPKTEDYVYLYIDTI